jgi:tungstate transport system substrate-binding protein
VYSVIAISPERHPDTNSDGANKLVQFLTSEEIQDFIGSYGLSEYGTPLFTPARGQEPQ